MPILYSFFQKIEVEGILPNLSYEASISHVSKPDSITRNENYRSTRLMDTDTKILSKISKSNPTKLNLPKN